MKNTITFYDNGGGLHGRAYTDSDPVEVAKSELEERDLCLAIIDDSEGRLQKVQRGTYRFLFLIHEGKAYIINNAKGGQA